MNAGSNARSKVYVEGPRPDIQVPFTQVELSGGEEPIRLYDTSGPGSDPEVGLPKLREAWIAERRDAAASKIEHGGAELDCPTQLHYAKQGVVTPEMAYVAVREGLEAEFVRAEDDQNRDGVLRAARIVRRHQSQDEPQTVHPIAMLELPGKLDDWRRRVERQRAIRRGSAVPCRA